MGAATTGDDTGLAPPPRAIDRHAPYKRIATEEAWNIPEILEAQVRLLGSANAPNDTSLRMAGMFSKLTELQAQLMDIGAQRLARMDELGIDKQLLLLTSPGVQVLEPDEGTALAQLANDRLAEVCRRSRMRSVRHGDLPVQRAACRHATRAAHASSSVVCW